MRFWGIGRICPGLPTFTWKRATSIAGGSTVRCWWRWERNGAAPYRQVLTHGWVLDAQGRAMSKSIGNVIEPQEVIKTHGAEILRLWAASVEFGEDVSISPDMLTRLSEAYRKLRNTFRYCLGNLYDFDPAKDCVDASQLEEIDSWALVRTAELLERAQAAYDEYAFHKVYRGVYDFATVDLSAFYFDILKDRLYTAPAGSVRRRAAQTTLYRIADALVRVRGAAAELYRGRSLDAPSRSAICGKRAFTWPSMFPPRDLRAGLSDKHLQRMENWPRLIALREEVLKALEVARRGEIHRRLAGGSRGPGGQPAIFCRWWSSTATSCRYLFIVSQVEIAHTSDGRRNRHGVGRPERENRKSPRPEMRSLLELFRTGG